MVGITRLFPGPGYIFESKSRTLISQLGFLLYLLLPLSILSTVSNIMASSFSDDRSLYLQDYMKKEHLGSNNYDPVILEGYNYPIFLDTSNNKVIKVSQFWLSNGGLLGSRSGSDSTLLKEFCLSFALSRLLKRRFFGAACPEAKLQKTHDLVFRGVAVQCRRDLSAYRVIETKLAFIHDHFFIASPIFGPVIVTISIVKAAIFYRS